MNDEKIVTTESGELKPQRRNHTPSPLQPIFYAGVLIVGMFIGTNLGDKNILQVKTARDENPNKLVSLIDYIEDNYVDSVDKRKLIDDAIRSVLQNLDPHSYYMTAEETAEEQEKLQGKFGGVGIEFIILRDTLMVVKTVEDGPASKSGVLDGDRIVKVDGKEISGKSLRSDKVQGMLKGDPGTEVQIVVYRPGEETLKDIVIKRGNIPIESLQASFMVNDSVGYVKLERFAQTTYVEFMKAATDLKMQGCKKIIFDLRGNGGGLMDQATKIAGEFLPDNKRILYTEGLHNGKEEVYTEKDGQFLDMGLVVLIDQNSASASEIVAGALQDWDRSITVGRRSFGKGLVQHEMEMADRSALRLTVARYYTPSGRCVQKPYGDSIAYHDDFHQRLVRGELTVADSVHFPDSLKYKTAGGRTVYGAGGIMPDVFVPLDSIYFSGLLSDLAYSSVIRDYAFNYIDANRKDLKKYKSSDEFVSDFVVSEAMLQTMLASAQKEKIEVKKSVLSKVAPQIKARIKAQIARNLYGDTAMYKVLLQSDQDFKKAQSIAAQGANTTAPAPKSKKK
jgi:carboxyl-terminal processing protease